ncbi:MAG: Rid family hydrolase, partial [Gammaproteobacteria bacterium]
AEVPKCPVYPTTLDHFPRDYEIMAETLSEPFPARAAIEVSALPKGAKVEIDAIAAIGPD